MISNNIIPKELSWLLFPQATIFKKNKRKCPSQVINIKSNASDEVGVVRRRSHKGATMRIAI